MQLVGAVPRLPNKRVRGLDSAHTGLATFTAKQWPLPISVRNPILIVAGSEQGFPVGERTKRNHLPANQSGLRQRKLG